MIIINTMTEDRFGPSNNIGTIEFILADGTRVIVKDK